MRLMAARHARRPSNPPGLNGPHGTPVWTFPAYLWQSALSGFLPESSFLNLSVMARVPTNGAGASMPSVSRCFEAATATLAQSELLMQALPSWQVRGEERRMTRP